MFNKRKYERERNFEKQSQIRLRGRSWFQYSIFAIYLIAAIFLALVVGTFARVLYYLFVNGLLNLLLNRFGVSFDPAFSFDYLQQYISYSLAGGTFQDKSFVTWFIMIIVFVLIGRLGVKNTYDWIQKFGDRTTNQNRWASIFEIDAAYKLIPDRNKFYKGMAGQPITHISGYSINFLRVHPLLWLIQILKKTLGLNKQVFPVYYQKLRKIMLKTPLVAILFKNQENVEGGFEGFYWIDTKPTHTSITAPTRIGKDQRIGYPTIDVFRRALIQPNIIDTDAKNEDGKMSFLPLLKAGYDVNYINIMDPNWSELWNPFQVALDYAMEGDFEKATNEASVIVQIIGSAGDTDGFGGDNTWDKAAEDTQLAIILILLWLAIEHQDPTLATPANVPQFIESMSRFSDPKDKNKDGLSQYLNLLRQLDPQPPLIRGAILKAGSYLGATGDTRTSVMFTLQRHSSLFATETVAKLTSNSTIHISDYGFPRMLKVNLPMDYAGATAYIELYDAKHVETTFIDRLINTGRIIRHPIKGWKRGSKPFLEQDAMKVSSTGAVHYPFKNNFPEKWLIRIRFDNKDNPHHLRKSWIELPGERREKYSLGGKKIVDKYTGKPQIKIVPGALKYSLFGNGRAKYELRYSEKPMATFIVAPQNNDNYSALASLFIGQVFSINTQIASEITRRKMDRWIIYKLNEFSMWPPVPGFSNILTRGLTYGHIVNIYLQDDVQISKHYSDKESVEIKNNMLTQYYLASKDEGTKSEVSKRLGDIQVQKELVNSQMGEQQQDRGNRVVSIDTVPLLSEKEFEELLEGEVVIFRLAARTDEKYKKLRALPIFDTQGLSMPNSRDLLGKTYRLDYYTTDLPIKNNVKHLTYEDLFQDFTGYFYELSEYSDNPSGAQIDVGPLIKDVGDLSAALENAYQGDSPQLTETQISEEEAYTQWRQHFEKHLDEPFISEELMTNINLVMEVEELINGLIRKKHYLSRTDAQTNALQLSERGALFETLPELNTNRNILNLLDRNIESVYEVQKRLTGRADYLGTEEVSATDDAMSEPDSDENLLDSNSKDYSLSEDELAALTQVQQNYDL